MPKEAARYTARWMWNDLRASAASNPFRWSKWKTIEETLQEFDAYKDQERPLLVQVNGNDLAMDNIAQAIAKVSLERRPTVGDWVSVRRANRDPNRPGLVTTDDHSEECYMIVYGGEQDPWLKETEVRLLPPVTDAARWQLVLRDDGLLLQYAPEEVRNTRAVASTAVAQNAQALRYITDTAGLVAAVTRDGEVLKDAPPEVKGNREVVIAAVSKTPSALRYASEELRADPGVVAAAMEKDKDAIKFAAAHLRANPELVSAIGASARS